MIEGQKRIRSDIKSSAICQVTPEIANLFRYFVKEGQSVKYFKLKSLKLLNFSYLTVNHETKSYQGRLYLYR